MDLHIGVKTAQQRFTQRKQIMARTNYSYEKRGRELEKQKKQEEKRQKKRAKQSGEIEETETTPPPNEENSSTESPSET